MESLSENRPLLWSIAISGLAIVGLLSGSSPEFNEQFALVDIPMDVRKKTKHIIVIIVKFFVCFCSMYCHCDQWQYNDTVISIIVIVKVVVYGLY